MEWPIIEATKIQILLLKLSLAPEANKGEGIPVIREKRQQVHYLRLDGLRTPETEVPHGNHKSEVTTPRFSAMAVSPFCSSPGRTISTEHIGSDFQKIYEP